MGIEWLGILIQLTLVLYGFRLLHSQGEDIKLMNKIDKLITKKNKLTDIDKE